MRESNANPDNILKLESAEMKLRELKSNMTTLGKEAAAAMAAVEGQQQRLTIQRLIAMVMNYFFLICNMPNYHCYNVNSIESAFASFHFFLIEG